MVPFSSRRRVLQLICTASMSLSVGCIGNQGNSKGTGTPEDSPTKSNTNDTDSSESSTADANQESIFIDYGTKETDLVVEIAEESLSTVESIELTTPSDEKEIDVSDTVTKYSIFILYQRAGAWSLTALDRDNNILETVRFEMSREILLKNIGTLSELGITSSRPGREYVNYQFTVANTGDIPVEPIKVEVIVPQFNTSKVYIEQDYLNEPSSGLVDLDEDFTMPSGEENTYRFQSDLLAFRGDEADKKAGRSFDGEIVIKYEHPRGFAEKTVIPIEIEFGDEMSSSGWLKGTTISKR